MIARIWKGRTPAAKAEAYVDLMRRTGLKDYRAAPGNLGVWLIQRDRGGVAEFRFLTLWDSFDSIRGFAGPEPAKALYYPEDDAFLLEKEPEVEHFEVVLHESGRPL